MLSHGNRVGSRPTSGYGRALAQHNLGPTQPTGNRAFLAVLVFGLLLGASSCAHKASTADTSTGTNAPPQSESENSGVTIPNPDTGNSQSLPHRISDNFGSAIPVTSADGFEYTVQASSPALIGSFNTQQMGTQVAPPGSYYIAVAIKITNKQTDRPTPMLSDELSFGLGFQQNAVPPQLHGDCGAWGDSTSNDTPSSQLPLGVCVPSGHAYLVNSKTGVIWGCDIGGFCQDRTQLGAGQSTTVFFYGRQYTADTTLGGLRLLAYTVAGSNSGAIRYYNIPLGS